MTKLEQAARQALEFLESGDFVYQTDLASTLREALDHSGEATEMVQSVSQEATAEATLRVKRLLERDGCYSYANMIKEQPVSQEPVAWAHPSGGYLSARYMKEFATGLEKETHIIPLYAAPVRTKDMTHEEKAEIVTAYYPFVYKIIDAVIAADREKNK